MAIDAPNVALFDLSADALPSHPGNHPTHIPELIGGITVVELEHDGVPIAAVDAWMRGEVREDFPTVLLSSSFRLNDGSIYVVGLVRQIMRAAIGRVADTTVRIKHSTGPVRERELPRRLIPPAHRAAQEAIRQRTQ